MGCEERLDPAGTGSLYNEGEADIVVNHVISLLYAGKRSIFSLGYSSCCNAKT